MSEWLHLYFFVGTTFGGYVVGTIKDQEDFWPVAMIAVGMIFVWPAFVLFLIYRRVCR